MEREQHQVRALNTTSAIRPYLRGTTPVSDRFLPHSQPQPDQSNDGGDTEAINSIRELHGKLMGVYAQNHELAETMMYMYMTLNRVHELWLEQLHGNMLGLHTTMQDMLDGVDLLSQSELDRMQLEQARIMREFQRMNYSTFDSVESTLSKKAISAEMRRELDQMDVRNVQITDLFNTHEAQWYAQTFCAHYDPSDSAVTKRAGLHTALYRYLTHTYEDDLSHVTRVPAAPSVSRATPSSASAVELKLPALFAVYERAWQTLLSPSLSFGSGGDYRRAPLVSTVASVVADQSLRSHHVRGNYRYSMYSEYSVFRGQCERYTIVDMPSSIKKNAGYVDDIDDDVDADDGASPVRRRHHPPRSGDAVLVAPLSALVAASGDLFEADADAMPDTQKLRVMYLIGLYVYAVLYSKGVASVRVPDTRENKTHVMARIVVFRDWYRPPVPATPTSGGSPLQLREARRAVARFLLYRAMRYLRREHVDNARSVVYEDRFKTRFGELHAFFHQTYAVRADTLDGALAPHLAALLFDNGHYWSSPVGTYRPGQDTDGVRKDGRALCLGLAGAASKTVSLLNMCAALRGGGGPRREAASGASTESECNGTTLEVWLSALGTPALNVYLKERYPALVPRLLLEQLFPRGTHFDDPVKSDYLEYMLDAIHRSRQYLLLHLIHCNLGLHDHDPCQPARINQKHAFRVHDIVTGTPSPLSDALMLACATAVVGKANKSGRARTTSAETRQLMLTTERVFHPVPVGEATRVCPLLKQILATTVAAAAASEAAAAAIQAAADAERAAAGAAAASRAAEGEEGEQASHPPLSAPLNSVLTLSPAGCRTETGRTRSTRRRPQTVGVDDVQNVSQLFMRRWVEGYSAAADPFKPFLDQALRYACMRHRSEYDAAVEAIRRFSATPDAARPAQLQDVDSFAGSLLRVTTGDGNDVRLQIALHDMPNAVPHTHLFAVLTHPPVNTRDRLQRAAPVERAYYRFTARLQCFVRLRSGDATALHVVRIDPDAHRGRVHDAKQIVDTKYIFIAVHEDHAVADDDASATTNQIRHVSINDHVLHPLAPLQDMLPDASPEIFALKNSQLNHGFRLVPYGSAFGLMETTGEMLAKSDHLQVAKERVAEVVDAIVPDTTLPGYLTLKRASARQEPLPSGAVVLKIVHHNPDGDQVLYSFSNGPQLHASFHAVFRQLKHLQAGLTIQYVPPYQRGYILAPLSVARTQ